MSRNNVNTKMQETLWDDQKASGAIIVDNYRYLLWRCWDEQRSRVVFIMLNPSTGDGQNVDPTLRRCISFAQSWGYGAIDVINLYAWRSPQPADVWQAPEPVGPENDRFIEQAVEQAACIVCAWGAYKKALPRMIAVLDRLKAYNLHCLEITQDGFPRHPLYIKGERKPSLFVGSQSIEVRQR